ncbi:hypothetical protein AZ34_05335 [Hylemonella gracilis str. Niagara R]|uniref:AsmA family protein n=1 Tax=Hylemonella gracilis str. Niagara R TaxID=1458275 RepID=A0A016XF94_9BURK|nr:hypothetical protein [Hylemonella gracilis]EYC50540.1 hypothetical protein AZ34_05335 [Hylemonella gracilis str. Niagara R]
MPRWTKIVAGALLALGLLAATVLAVAALLLQQLDHPWLKPRVLAAVEAATGLRMDYQHASLSLTSGLRLEQLVVLTPAPLDGAAPELLRVGRLEADWSLGALLWGPVRVARVAVHDVAVVWVADEAGANSLSVLAPDPPSQQAIDQDQDASPGASRQFADLFSAVAPVGQVELSGLALDVVRVRGGAVVERWSLRGLGLAVQVQPQEDRGWKLQAELGRPDAPLVLALQRVLAQGEGAGKPPAWAQLALSLGLQASAAGAQAQISLDLRRHNFDARIPAGTLLRGAVTANVDAARQGLAIALHPTRLADSADAQASLFLPDDPKAPIVVSQARVDADLARVLRLFPADLRPLTLERGQLHLEVTGLALALGDLQGGLAKGAGSGPATGPARGRVTLQADAAHAELAVEQTGDALRWTATAQAPDLTLARPFLSDALLARLPWRRLGVNLQSQGRVEALWSSAPRIAHRTELQLLRPAWDGTVSARELVAVLDSQGDAWQHRGELHLRAEGLRVHEQDAGAQRHTLAFEVDRRPAAPGAPSAAKFEARARLSNQAGVQLMFDAALAFDPQAHALRGRLKARWPAQPLLAPLRAYLPAALDAEGLALELDAQGALTGVFTRIGDDGLPQLAPDPMASAGFEGRALIEAGGLHWQQDGLELQLPSVRWQLVSHPGASAKVRRQLSTELSAERVSVTLAERGLTLTRVTATTETSFGANPEDEPELALHLKVDSLEQQPALPYPVRQLEWRVRARRDAEGTFHLPEFALTHAATRSRLTAQGRLDLAPERRRFALQGVLSQDLAGLSQPGVVEGRGHASVDFDLASPDLTTFRTQASLRLDDVNLSLPGLGVVVEGLDGDIPVDEDVRWTGGRLELLGNLALNPYAMLRHTDQSPLLSRGGYVSARSINTPWVRIAPLAGNLSVRQNVLALNQFEMGVREGRVTGQSRLDWRGRDSVLELRLRATGVRSSHGEPFDGHAAVVIAARDRSVNGRAEILRIGSRHLLDLLDLVDPQAADPSINRVRFALGLGYPEHVRLRFDQGFGRLLVKLGGGAGLVRIDEIRGIPMGPIVDRALHTVQLSTD